MSISQPTDLNLHGTDVNGLRAFIIGLASAGMIMAFFGTMWWAIGGEVVQAQSPLAITLFYVVIGIAAIVLVIASIRILLHPHKLSDRINYNGGTLLYLSVYRMIWFTCRKMTS